MEGFESDLREIFQLLEQEILKYQKLIEALKRESEYLRRNVTEPLMDVLKEIGNETEVIFSLEEKIKECLGNILSHIGLKEDEFTLSTLLPFLPISSQRKIHSYQRSLRELKVEVKQINDLNKAFIQECLTLWTDVVSTLIHPPIESQNYSYQGAKGGRRISPYLPLTLNREV